MSPSWQAGLGLLALIVISVALAVITAPSDEEDLMSDVDDTDPTGHPQVVPDLGPPVDRPEPLQDVAKSVAKVLGVSSGLVSAVLGYLLLLLIIRDPVQALAGVLAGPAAGLSVVTGAVRTANSARPLVTPDSDPKTWVVDELGRKVLAELVAAGRHSKES